MAVEYKVWIQVEKVDEENDKFENETEPDPLLVTEDRDKAVAVMEAIRTLMWNITGQYELGTGLRTTE